jgi:hypothetical protein
MTLRRTALPLFLLVLCLLALVSASLGQTETATLTGLITDPQGQVVPNVAVEVTNVDTNVSVHQTTNGAGLYVVVGLKPGRYRVSVIKEGFRRIDLTDLVLNVQDVLSRNFQLQLGPVLASITVVAQEAQVNTENAAVSTVIDRNFVESLPLNGRSFNTLLQLTPGVITAPANPGSPGQFSVAGQRTDANNFMVDGVSANFGTTATFYPGESGTGTGQAFSALGGTSSLVSVEALQEFRVETSSFAPEFGTAPGAQVVLTTRSGTNALHGGAYEYFRNTVFDANDWFAENAGQKRAPEHHNDFGGFLGGPIWKNRTFFFFSYEGARLDLPQTSVIQVPSDSARNSADPAIAPFLNAYPQPNGPVSSDPAIAQFTGSYANRATLNATSLRIDHVVNGRVTIFGRYNYAPSKTVNRIASLSTLEADPVNTQTLTAGVNALFGSRLSTASRFNYSVQESSSVDSLDSFGGAIVPPSSIFLGSLSNRDNAAFFEPEDITYYSVGLNSKNRSRQFDVNNDTTWAVGTHQLKVGGDYRTILLRATRPNYYLEYFPPDVGSFVSSDSSSLTALFNRSSQILTRTVGLYAQDTWKPTRKLTLSYGLRWELRPAPAPQGTTELASWLNIDNPQQLQLAPVGTPLWKTRYSYFAPRLGVVYGFGEHQDFVLRAGWGIFYDSGLGTSANTTSSYPNSTSSVFGTVSLPLSNIGNYLPQAPSLQPPYPDGIYAYSPTLVLPRSYQWNIAIEKSFAGKQVVSATYVGQAGRNLLRQEVLYQPNGNFLGAFDLTKNDAWSNYNALQLQFRRTLSAGLRGLLSYTYSHSLDNVSNDVAIGLANSTVISGASDYGSSDFDVRHSLSGALTYTLPAATRSDLVSLLSRGWSIDAVVVARSGFPFNMLVSENSPLTGFAFTRPDIVPGQSVWIDSPTAPGGKEINSNAFVTPQSPRQGTEPRNSIKGFGLSQVDLSIARTFPLHESLKLQFRADAFNVLNHPNFTNPPGYIQFGQYGFQSQQMLNNGLGGLNPIFQQGGPRSLQLSLRLSF